MINFRKLVENFSSLTIINIYSLLLPFLLYPYLIRVGGVDSYGELVLYQSYAMFMIITVSYGFDISGTKLIASSSDEEKIKKLSSVTQAKIILAIISLVIFYVLFLLNVINSIQFYIAFSVLIASEVFNLNWFFLAIEKTKISLLTNIIVKTVFYILTYFMIEESTDLWFYPLFLSFGNITVGVILLYFACKTYKEMPSITSFKLVMALLKDSFPFYISRIMVVFRERFSAILIGLYLGASDLAFYDMCQKILNLLVTPIGILNSTIYPTVSKYRKFHIVKLSIIISLIYAVVTIILLYIFSNEIIYMLLNDSSFYNKSYLLNILSCILVLQVFIYFLGNTYLVVKEKKKEFNYSIIYSTVMYIVFVLGFIYWGRFDLLIASVGFILCYSIAALHRIYISLRIHYGRV